MTFQGQLIPVLPHKGLNNGRDATQVEEGQTPDCQNVRFRFKSVRKRDGFSGYIGVHPSSSAVTGIAQFIKSDATTGQVSFAGNDAFRENAGAWTSIKGLVTLTAGQDNLWQFAQLTDLLICVNNVDQILKWSGGVASLVQLGGTAGVVDTARCVTSYKNYVLLGNLVEGGARTREKMRWSELNNAELWPAANTNVFLNKSGQQFTGFGKVGDECYAFLDRSIHKVSYTGDAEIPFAFPSASPEIGCVAGNAIVSVDWGIFFPSYRGIYFFDGSDPKYVSAEVEGTWRTLNSARLPQIVGWHNPKFNEVCFSVSTGGTNNVVLVFDYLDQSWTRFSAFNANAAAIFSATAPLQPIIGNYAGKVHKTNSGSFNDDGVSIDAYVTTRPQNFGDPGRRRKIRRMQFLVAADTTADAVLEVSTSYDLAAFGAVRLVSTYGGGSLFDQAAWDVDGWAGDTQMVVFDRPPSGTGTYWQAKIRNNQKDVNMGVQETFCWVRGEGKEGLGYQQPQEQ